MNIRLMKSVDAAIGRAAAMLLPPPRNPETRRPGSLLLIRPGGIGDAVLLSPAISLLQRAFPGVSIDVIAETRNAAAFRLCPGIRSIFLYHRPAELLRLLRNGYDVVIDTEQWHRLSAVVARLVSSGVKIGYDTNERRRLFTHRVVYSHHRYEAESFLDLLKPLGIEPKFEPEEPFLVVPPEAERRAAELLPGGTFVTMFPGASIPERRWGRERFHDLSLRLSRRGIRSVVIGGGGDVDDGDAIVSGTEEINLTGKTALAETAAVIRRSALLVSGDSGVLHIAVGLGVPTVSLFGSGIQDKWGPQGKKHVVINKKLPCSPCTKFGYTPRCPYNARCMSEITVDEIESAILRLLPPGSP
jgi:ADP-heptose:LPS heptosyltransferase